VEPNQASTFSPIKAPSDKVSDSDWKRITDETSANGNITPIVVTAIPGYSGPRPSDQLTGQAQYVARILEANIAKTGNLILSVQSELNSGRITQAEGDKQLARLREELNFSTTQYNQLIPTQPPSPTTSTSTMEETSSTQVSDQLERSDVSADEDPLRSGSGLQSRRQRK
jgi:hypothetical protein